MALRTVILWISSNRSSLELIKAGIGRNTQLLKISSGSVQYILSISMFTFQTIIL